MAHRARTDLHTLISFWKHLHSNSYVRRQKRNGSVCVLLGLSGFISLELSDFWRKRVFILLPMQKLQTLGYKTVLNYFFFFFLIEFHPSIKNKQKCTVYVLWLILKYFYSYYEIPWCSYKHADKITLGASLKNSVLSFYFTMNLSKTQYAYQDKKYTFIYSFKIN